MARKPSVRYFPSRSAFYCQHRGKQHKLAEGPDDAPDGPTFLRALDEFKALMELESVGQAGDRNTIRTIFEHYMNFIEDKRAPQTVALRHVHLRTFCRFEDFAECPINRLTHHMVYRFLDFKRQERTWKGIHGITRKTFWGKTTQRLALDSINAALNWAVKSGMISRNPLKGIERPPSGNKGDALLIDDKLHGVLMSSVRRHFKQVLTFLRGTGCRPSELCAIEEKHYDGKMKAIIFRQASNLKDGDFRHKNAKKKDRTIFLKGEALSLVERLAEKHPTGKLFKTKAGNDWTTNKIVTMFLRLRRRLGIAGLTAYCYRHTFATNWLLQGKPVDVLAVLLGNSPEVIRKHYSHLMQDTDRIRQHLEGFAD